ncbi:MAG: hypothetical protein HY652_01500 [Acidobacteria bacterium]|nr:hypothetical protein [Acidobacteriota bacterium]
MSRLRIPEPLRHEAEEIFKLTDPFCAEHLDAEYPQLCRKLMAKLARKRPSPLAQCRPRSRRKGLIPDLPPRPDGSEGGGHL